MADQTSGLSEKRVALAYDIAMQIYNAGHREKDGMTVLAMAMGIYMETHEGSHRNLEPLHDALLQSAKLTFDAFRDGRRRKEAHA